MILVALFELCKKCCGGRCDELQRYLPVLFGQGIDGGESSRLTSTATQSEDVTQQVRVGSREASAQNPVSSVASVRPVGQDLTTVGRDVPVPQRSTGPVIPPSVRFPPTCAPPRTPFSPRLFPRYHSTPYDVPRTRYTCMDRSVGAARRYQGYVAPNTVQPRVPGVPGPVFNRPRSVFLSREAA